MRPLPSHCSGLMYAGVPMTRPVRVLCDCPPSPVSLAMPKSSSLTKFLSPPRGQQVDVLGLEVAVDDALGVRRGERRAALLHHVHRLLERETGAAEPGGERFAVEELHDEVDDVLAVVVLHLAEVDDVDDVVVADVVDRLRFVEEAR